MGDVHMYIHIIWLFPSHYLVLNADIGDSRDAFHAGYKPAIALIINESIQTLSRSVVLNTGVM